MAVYQSKTPAKTLDADHLAIRKSMTSSAEAEAKLQMRQQAQTRLIERTFSNVRLGDPIENRPFKARRLLDALKSTSVRLVLWLRQRNGWISTIVFAMLLLFWTKPIIGVILGFALLLIGLRFIMGSHMFWRRFIAGYIFLKARQPRLARQLKLRSYVLARKWQHALNRLPSALADPLRPPDLAALLVADAKHDAVVAARLNRIKQGGAQ